MVSPAALGFFVWAVVCLGVGVASGDVYYAITQVWIPIVPVMCFGTAMLIERLLRQRQRYRRYGWRRDHNNRTGGQFQPKRLAICGSTLAGVGLALTTAISIRIATALGISIFRAQDVRDAFYDPQMLLALGGAYFMWIGWVVAALNYTALFLGLAQDVSRRRPFSRTTVAAMSSLIIWSLATGGRTDIFNMIVIYAAGWLSIASWRTVKLRRVVLRAVVVGLALVMPLLFQQQNRQSVTAASIGEMTLVKYFIGPTFAFDRLITTGIVDEIRGVISRPTLGLYGLDTVFVSGLGRGLLGAKMDSALSLTSPYFHNGVDIAPAVIMNAAYTAGSKFYIDFGAIYYAFFYVLLAAICAFGFRKRSARVTYWFPCLYSFTSFVIVLSPRQFVFDSPTFVFAASFLFVLSRVAPIRRKTSGLSAPTAECSS